jgi:hypothetical protein
VASVCPVIEAYKKASLDAVLETCTEWRLYVQYRGTLEGISRLFSGEMYIVASVCPIIKACRKVSLDAVLETWTEWRLYV